MIKTVPTKKTVIIDTTKPVCEVVKQVNAVMEHIKKNKSWNYTASYPSHVRDHINLKLITADCNGSSLEETVMLEMTNSLAHDLLTVMYNHKKQQADYQEELRKTRETINIEIKHISEGHTAEFEAFKAKAEVRLQEIEKKYGRK